ncbi:MAG: sensor histidine kinase [Rhodopila sp.]
MNPPLKPARSLRLRLFALWLLSLAASIAVSLLLLQLYELTATAQVARAEAVVARSCDLIRDRYGFFVAGWSTPVPDLADPQLRARLADVIGLALSHQDGVEGGLWQASAGPLAYAFPTYEGTGPKTDLPAAERPQIEAVNRQAVREQQYVNRQVRSRAQTLLLYACPVSGPIAGLTAWTMMRVNAAPGLWPLLLGLAVPLTLLLGMAAWLGRTLLVWRRHLSRIERALAGAGRRGMPEVPLTGEAELDRIIGALNDAGQRVLAAQRDTDAMANRAARAERLAALGRVAAGVAHEIRNPIAAARLQGENALAGDDSRRRAAISDMLIQLGRLDVLVAELLAMTQRAVPQLVPVDLQAFLNACVANHEPLAAARGIVLVTGGADGQVHLDPVMTGRILDNLLTNAIRHTPRGGGVTVTAEQTGQMLSFIVEDTGEGVAPDLASRLFEPFVTGRAEGTGLGLAIARELAEAHGGRLVLRRSGGAERNQSAVFALELPTEPPCRPS